MTEEMVFVIWRSGNATLAAIGLVMLLLDVWRRRSLGVSARFYWEAVALLLVGSMYTSISNIIDDAPPAVVRSTITTVAMTYLLISIAVAWSQTRRGPSEDE